mgnify:CR=1 FL=1
MAKNEMTPEEQKALHLAGALATHELPSHTPMHAALVAARARQDAQLVARVAALAGVSLDDLMATQKAASAAAGAAMHKQIVEA